MKYHFFIKCIQGSAITIAFNIFSLFTDAYAQHYDELYFSNGDYTRIDRSNIGLTAVAIENGKIVSVEKENPKEVVRVIVTFKDSPLAAYQVKNSSLQKTSITSVYVDLQSSHASFRKILNTIEQQLSAQHKSDYSYTILRDYYRALNGIALECKYGMIDKIRALPMVQSIKTDTKVTSDLAQSVHQIRADIVQDSLGYTGAGVLVGNIDTGIDYDNPSLGGGFGPAFRVISGYDFVNNDNDPMDDEGHGTHVAGIIGANGDTLRGVAPGVKFLAVKVLDANGKGWSSDVIAGIDYCLDPDDNPETDDAVDIINMSFGGTPSYDSPKDNAVDNATRSGVLSVVAAGNTGFGRYGSIESPGTSESALTVGACDSVNSIASFSSLGPALTYYAIKPEVVAPGVNILSTILNNQTASLSGTSMAAPHVTGIAALLKQQHPLWAPEEIKAAIINSAHSVGNNVSIFAQGKGWVDALDAATARMMVEPGVISFGMVDLAKDVWMDTVKLTIKNLHPASQNIRISITEGVPIGATLTLGQTSFSLAPGEKTTILAVLAVPSSVPVLSTEPFAYLGKIEVLSGPDSIVVPFSFTKGSILVIDFDRQPLKIALIDRTKATVTNPGVIPEGATKLAFPVTFGRPLEILALMKHDTLDVRNYYIVDHKIDDPSRLSFDFVSHHEATIGLIDTIYDIHNNKVTIDSFSYINIALVKSLGQSQLEWHLGFNMLKDWQTSVSPLDSSFSIEKQLTATQDSDVFFLRKSYHSLQNRYDNPIGSGADNLVGYLVKGAYVDPYLENPSNLRKGIVIGLNKSKFASLHYVSSISKIYFNKQDIAQGVQNDKYRASSMWVGIAYVRALTFGILRTPDIFISETGEATFEQEQVTLLPWIAGEKFNAYKYAVMTSGDTIMIEQNAHVNIPDFLTYIHNGSLFIKNKNDWYDFGNSYGGIRQVNGVSEYRGLSNAYWNMPLFTLHAFAYNRVLTNMKPFSPWQQNLTLNNYDHFYAMYKYGNMENNTGTLRILSDAHPYTILGQAGQSTVDFEYRIPSDTNSATVFPSFNLVQVSVNGSAADIVRPEQTGIIRCVPFDPDGSITSVRLSLLLALGDEIVLPVKYSGENEYHASIPDYLPTGFIDVIAKIEDSHGNKCELTAGPGFYFGSTTDSVRFDARVRMSSYALTNVEAINMQAGDTLNYTLSYANYGNSSAQNVLVKLPATQYFKPVSSQTLTIDSIRATDTLKIPIRLVFLGKQQSGDERAYYSPSVSWISGGRTYLRNHKILVDLRNNRTKVTEAESTIPNKYELHQNYPNPFNPGTTIRYDLPKASHVSLVVYNILGQQIATLVDDIQSAGRYRIPWNGSESNSAASGIYLLCIHAGNFTKTIKLLALK
jgi:uncharacterized repeat protein (TIGR01451 family)